MRRRELRDALAFRLHAPCLRGSWFNKALHDSGRFLRGRPWLGSVSSRVLATALKPDPDLPATAERLHKLGEPADGHVGLPVHLAHCGPLDPICSATSRCVRPRCSRTSDIIYLARDGVRLYFNQSGNRWSEARPFLTECSVGPFRRLGVKTRVPSTPRRSPLVLGLALLLLGSPGAALNGNFRTGKTGQPEEIQRRFVLPAVLRPPDSQ